MRIKSEQHRRSELLKLPNEKLVDALIDLAMHNECAGEMVERLISRPDENLSRFEQKLANIGQPNQYHDWRSARSFAHEMRSMLDDLRAANPEPREGVRQVAAFYEADKAIFNSSDDLIGDLGGIFRYEALELFCEFAVRCSDKDWIIGRVLELNQNDGYGVRDALIEAAEKYLTNDELRRMANRCIELAENGAADRRQLHWLGAAESLAAQLKDARLFEKMRVSRSDKGPAACLDIARVYLESGDARVALEWIERVPKDETFQVSERDELLLEIYKSLGNKEAQEEVAWRSFRRYRSESSFQTLLSVIGVGKSDDVIGQSVVEILAEKTLRNSDAMFLISAKRLDKVETYLMARKDQLNGDHYSSLLEYAEAMESDRRYYAASIIYRKLTNSILGRGISKYYHHGARYLKKLDQLAPKVTDWRGDTEHAKYFATLKQEHSRKNAFWSQYASA